MHLVSYLYEDYHEARSLEHKVPLASFVPAQVVHKEKRHAIVTSLPSSATNVLC
jgi:hypothetical protein